MGIQLKRTAKAATLEALRIPGSGLVAGGMLGRMRIAFEPPRGEVCYPEGKAAAACISIDFDANTPERLEANRFGTFALVDLSEKHWIPLTWAICGKTAEEDPTAYRRLLDSSVQKEIGVHTYSHIDVSRSTAEDLRGEVSRCVGVLGLKDFPRTFVFPWNREGHFDVLRSMGFSAYRGKERVIGAPSKANGLWNIPPVYYVDHNSIGAASLIRRYIDTCIRFRSIFHLWLHPWSIVQRGDLAKMVSMTLDPVFEYMAKLREQGRLATSTMGEIAACMESAMAARSALAIGN